MSEKIKTPFGEIPFEVADLPNEAVFGLGKNQEVIKASDWIKKLQSQLLAEQEKVKKLVKRLVETESYIDDRYVKDRINETLEEVE